MKSKEYYRSEILQWKVRASEASKLRAGKKGLETFLIEKIAEIVFPDSEKEQIESKYIKKGVLCEATAIELVSAHLGAWPPLEKNTERKQNEWFTGECDVYWEENFTIIDTKVSWSNETHTKNILTPNPDYEDQGQVYMTLWDTELFGLAYVLTTTPAEANFGKEIKHQNNVAIKWYRKDQKEIENLKKLVESARIQMLDLLDKMFEVWESQMPKI